MILLIFLLLVGVAVAQQTQQCKAERNALAVRDNNRDWCEMALGRVLAEREDLAKKVKALEAEKEKNEPVPEEPK